MKINSFIGTFTKEKINYVKKGREYYLLNPDVEKLVKKLPDYFSAGLFLGEDKGNRFEPSPAFVDYLSYLSDRKVFVNKKAEWLFLCERDVLFESVDKQTVKKGYVFVQNSRDENLGYGLITSKSVKNLLDKGAYLRMER